MFVFLCKNDSRKKLPNVLKGMIRIVNILK
jgi:hypothetical protein